MHNMVVRWVLVGFVLLCVEGCVDEDNATLEAPPAPSILVQGGAVDFVATDIGQEDVQMLTVTNTSSAVLEIYSMTLVESDEDDLVEITPGDDWKREVILRRGEVIEFTLKWTPLNDISDSATIIIHSNDPAKPKVTLAVNTPR